MGCLAANPQGTRVLDERLRGATLPGLPGDRAFWDRTSTLSRPIGEHPDHVCCFRLFDGDGHNLNSLTFFQLLQTKLHPVLKFHRVSIARRLRRQLTEGCRLCCAKAMRSLKRG